MTIRQLLLPIILLSVLACQGPAEQSQQQTDPPPPNDMELSSWLNASGSQLVHHYWPAAISILPDGQALSGPTAIAAHWDDFFAGKIRQDLQIIAQIPAGASEEYRYELSSFALDDLQRFAQLVIWNLHDGPAQRELEFIVAYDSPETDFSGINTARELWMQHCNDHRVDLLINEVYSPNTLYYNHKPLLQGRAALISEYNYMTNENYQLQLNPIHTELVSKDLAIEIGQCGGSYGGRYVIIWQKQPDGRWMVLLDSNV
ncbi:MAG: hypothetical protein AAF433_14130 [Bacteroidota bacterium]